MLAAIALALAFMATPVEAKAPKIRDIYDTISANIILSKFTAMVQASDLGTFLSSRGPFTVFVPTDSAFSRLPPGTLENLLLPANKERLQIIVLFHVVNGKRLTAKDLLALKSVLSCQGTPIALKTTRTGTQYVMKAKLISSDIRCANGIINEIDSVLMPPESVMPPLVTTPPVALPVNPPTDSDAATNNAPNVHGSLNNAAPQ